METVSREAKLTDDISISHLLASIWLGVYHPIVWHRREGDHKQYNDELCITFTHIKVRMRHHQPINIRLWKFRGNLFRKLFLVFIWINFGFKHDNDWNNILYIKVSQKRRTEPFAIRCPKRKTTFYRWPRRQKRYNLNILLQESENINLYVFVSYLK